MSQNKLSLDDDITQVLPEFSNTPWAQGVKVKYLLNNTSGIYQFTAEETTKQHDEAWDVYQTIDYLKNKPSSSTPGETYAYSNQGFMVLGYLIEKISKLPLEVFFKEQLFSPTKMKNTHLPRKDTPMELIQTNQYPDLAYPHVYLGASGKFEKISGIDFCVPFSAGSIISTTKDLARWNNALYHGKIIPLELLKHMTTPNEVGYGDGILIEYLPQQNVMYWHNGIIDGYQSMLVYLEKLDTSIVILTNVNYMYMSNRVEGLKTGITSILLEK